MPPSADFHDYKTDTIKTWVVKPTREVLIALGIESVVADSLLQSGHDGLPVPFLRLRHYP